MTRKPAPVPDDASDRLVAHAGRTIWENLPQLLVMSVLLLAAAFPALYLATAIGWLVAWPLLVLGMAPVWAGVMAASLRLLDGDAVTSRQALVLVGRHGAAGLRIALVPAIVGAALLGCLDILDRRPDAGWVAIPFLLGLGLAIVIALALVPIFTVAIETGLTGVPLWLTSAGIAFARAIPVLGTALLFGMMAWLATVIGPVALLALAPLAGLAAAVAREALASAGTCGPADPR